MVPGAPAAGRDAWKRAKLVSNLGNAFDALFDPAGGWKDLLADAQAEAWAVFAAAGWDVTTPEEEERERGDGWRCRRSPDALAAAARPSRACRAGRTRSRPTTSTARSRCTDGAIGVPTPVNAALQHLAARSVRAGVAARSVPVDALRALV